MTLIYLTPLMLLLGKSVHGKHWNLPAARQQYVLCMPGFRLQMTGMLSGTQLCTLLFKLR